MEEDTLVALPQEADVWLRQEADLIAHHPIAYCLFRKAVVKLIVKLRVVPVYPTASLGA